VQPLLVKGKEKSADESRQGVENANTEHLRHSPADNQAMQWTADVARARAAGLSSRQPQIVQTFTTGDKETKNLHSSSSVSAPLAKQCLKGLTNTEDNALKFEEDRAACWSRIDTTSQIRV
jgi:hypothetical protein